MPRVVVRFETSEACDGVRVKVRVSVSVRVRVLSLGSRGCTAATAVVCRLNTM